MPFTRPADGIVIEERLRAFLEIRGRVFPTYEKHKDQLASTAEKGVTGVGELTRALATAKDLAMARALAQAEVGMSDSEYYFMIHQVYRTAWTGREAGRGEGQDMAAPVVDSRGAPPENVVLFRKYEKTIREYAMPGMDGGKLD